MCWMVLRELPKIINHKKTLHFVRMRKLDHHEIQRANPDQLEQLQRHPIKLWLHDIRSAHNVGAALRTADGAFIEEVLLSGYTPTPANKAVIKTALGAQDFVPWRLVEDLEQEVKTLKSNGYTLAALEITDHPTSSDQLENHHFPLCLVAGNEVEGVDQEMIDTCDLALEIPQFGAKQSLNVSVAIGIALFDLVRQFRKLSS